MKRAIAIIALVAWRSMSLLTFARSHPTLPASVLFNDTELHILTWFAQQRNHKPPITCEDAVILVAMLGGYIDGKKNRRPGYQIFNVGYEKLELLSYFYPCNQHKVEWEQKE